MAQGDIVGEKEWLTNAPRLKAWHREHLRGTARLTDFCVVQGGVVGLDRTGGVKGILPGFLSRTSQDGEYKGEIFRNASATNQQRQTFALGGGGESPS